MGADDHEDDGADQEDQPSGASEQEVERTVTRAGAATALRDVAAAVGAGRVVVGEGEDALGADVPAEVELETELELDGDGAELEIELEWDREEGGTGAASEADHGEAETRDGESAAEAGHGDDADEAPEAEPAASDEPVPVGGPAAGSSKARFEVFRDEADEWRWRLRHHNGNVVATSGEGYGRRRDARRGMESVRANAPGAAVEDPAEDP